MNTERKYAIVYLSLFVLTLSLVACAPREKNDRPDPGPLKPTPLAMLGIKVKGTPVGVREAKSVIHDCGPTSDAASVATLEELSDSQNKLWLEICKKEESNETLVASFVEAHYNDYLSATAQKSSEVQTTGASFLEKIKSIAESSDLNQADQNNLKMVFEDNLEASVGELLYDKSHASVISVLEDQRMQCFSGTSLFEIVRHLRDEKVYENDMAVVIFTDGHVLPGYIKRHGVEANFDLYGIETTAKGKALVRFGNTRELKGVRVVEANFFMATEVFESQIANPREVMNNALIITASRYGIPLEEIEKKVATPALAFKKGETAPVAPGALAADFQSRINHSIFAFGSSADIPSGPIKRDRMDEVKIEKSGKEVIQKTAGVNTGISTGRPTRLNGDIPMPSPEELKEMSPEEIKKLEEILGQQLIFEEGANPTPTPPSKKIDRSEAMESTNDTH